MRKHTRTRMALAPIAVATLALGFTACSDDDGNEDDIDNPLDGVDDQLDDELDDMDDNITTEVPTNDSDGG